MSYSSSTDFLALLRLVSGSVRMERMPGLDFLVSALARAGLFKLAVQATAPTTNQSTTVWFKPATPAWASEGILFLWNSTTGLYEPATPVLWSTLLAPASSGATPVVQDVSVAGPVTINTNTTILRVLNVGAPVTLTLPLSSTKIGGVLVTDWANLAGTNNITINRSGGDVFPNSATSEVLAGDGASILFRPLPGGYAI
jgi:hypothetical protein